jgi:hypothetical protein
MTDSGGYTDLMSPIVLAWDGYYGWSHAAVLSSARKTEQSA